MLVKGLIPIDIAMLLFSWTYLKLVEELNGENRLGAVLFQIKVFYWTVRISPWKKIGQISVKCVHDRKFQPQTKKTTYMPKPSTKHSFADTTKHRHMLTNALISPYFLNLLFSRSSFCYFLFSLFLLSIFLPSAMDSILWNKSPTFEIKSQKLFRSK